MARRVRICPSMVLSNRQKLPRPSDLARQSDRSALRSSMSAERRAEVAAMPTLAPMTARFPPRS